MKIGVISDIHGDRDKKLRIVTKKLVDVYNVDMFACCGDIESQDLNLEAFQNLPVICAINKEQMEKPAFLAPPLGWIFTYPDKRIVDFNHVRMGVSHKRTFDFLLGSEQKIIQFLEEMHKEHDGLRWYFCGHTHHQVFVQSPLTNLINPGAIEDSFDGYGFAVADTCNRQVIFSRLMKTCPIISEFSVMVISDSGKISKKDPFFWGLLKKEAKDRNVSVIIHCGNLEIDDIGRLELDDFQIYYNLRKDQVTKKTAHNWHLIDREKNPVVTIGDYRFYVELDLGANLLNQSEVDMHKFCIELRKAFPELDYILCGFTNNALLVEEQRSKIVNPGDAYNDRNFAVIHLPPATITFGHVPYAPMPD